MICVSKNYRLTNWTFWTESIKNRRVYQFPATLCWSETNVKMVSWTGGFHASDPDFNIQPPPLSHRHSGIPVTHLCPATEIDRGNAPGGVGPSIYIYIYQCHILSGRTFLIVSLFLENFLIFIHILNKRHYINTIFL